jgi:hypothetical protein
VNYGFGYMGIGFVGGFWSGTVFRYNTAVTNVNRTVIRNVYVDRNIVNRTIITNNRVSFNGPRGVMARPMPQEQMAMRERHFQPTPTQFAHQQSAGQDRAQLASFNHGRPPVVAMDSVNGRRFNPQGRIANNVSSGRVTAPERRSEQQQRPSQGIRSAEPVPRQPAKVDNRERNINRQVSADHRVNGGRAAPAEKGNINREQNHPGRPASEEKHNEKVAPR